MRSVFRKAQKCLEEELDSTTLNQLLKKSGKKAAKTSVGASVEISIEEATMPVSNQN
jgi:hypothetical protein